MKPVTRVLKIISIICYLAIPISTQAGQQEIQLINWNSEQGIQRLAKSQYKLDFFELANHFQTQPNGVFCGPTSGSIVLNALRLGKKDDRLPYTSFNKQDAKFIPAKFTG